MQNSITVFAELFKPVKLYKFVHAGHANCFGKTVALFQLKYGGKYEENLLKKTGVFYLNFGGACYDFRHFRKENVYQNGVLFQAHSADFIEIVQFDVGHCGFIAISV